MTETIRCKTAQVSLDWGGTVRNRYLVRVPVEHGRDDVLSPDYLGDVMNGKRFTVGDIVEYEWHDFSRFIECQVRAQIPEVRQCVTQIRYEPEPMHIAIADGYTVEWRGADALHVILYEGKELKGGFPSPEAAAVHANYLAERAEAAAATRRAVNRTQRRAKAEAEA